MRYVPRVFSRRWFELHQAVLLWWANTLLGRLVLGIPLLAEPVRKLTPEACTTSRDGVHFHATIYQGTQYANRLFFALRPFWRVLHALDGFFARTGVTYNFGFDTFTLYSPDGSNAATGFVQRGSVAEVWATIRAGAGNTATYNDATYATMASLQAGGSSSQYSQLIRGITTFKLGSLVPAGAKAAAMSISAATVSIYGNYKANGLGATDLAIVAATPASKTALVTADFTQTGTTAYASNITYASYSTTGYNGFSLNAAGIASIDITTTHACFGFRLEWDRSGTFGGTWSAFATSYFRAATGTGKYPKLDLTYTVQPAPTVTNLTAGSAGVGYIGATASIGGAAVTSKRLQVSTVPTFATTEVDTGAVSDTIASGSTAAITAAWASPAAGVHYVRFGVENSYYNTMWSSTAIITVTAPTVDAVTITQDQEHLTIVANVTDTYAQPPRATAIVDGNVLPMLVADATPPSYQYAVTVDLERGAHTVQVEIVNTWAVVASAAQRVMVIYELDQDKTTARILWGDRDIQARDITWTTPTLDQLSTLRFTADEEITGVVRLESRRRGYESAQYRVTRHSKSGTGWQMQADAVELTQLRRTVDLQVKAATAWDLMQAAMGGIAPGGDYATLMPFIIVGQQYDVQAKDLVAQLLVQSSIMAWVRGGRWYAASRTAGVPRLAWSKNEPSVAMDSVDEVYNRVRAHYAVTQYPVPETALTEADAAHWTGTVTDVQLTDLLLKAPSGAMYMLRANGNISRTGLSIDIAAFDRLRFNWLPETAASMTIKLKQDTTNYLTYTRTFAGGRGSGFIATGTGAGGTAVKTISDPAGIRPVSLTMTMTQPCAVAIKLKRGGATVLDGGQIATWGDSNTIAVNIPASIYQGDAIDTIELTFTGLYPVNSGYGVSCTRLTIMQYAQVATVAGTARQIVDQRSLTCHMGVQTHYVDANSEEWGVAGVLGTVPDCDAGAGEQWTLEFPQGAVNCKIYDYTAEGGLRSVSKPVAVSISTIGQDIWAGCTIAVDAGHAGADGQIASVSGGSASGLLVKFRIISSYSYSWQVVEYTWASAYNLWDAIDIPLTSMVATGTTKTVTSIELTLTGINELDAISLGASNPVDHVVEAITGAGDLLYPDEGQQYKFQSREAAQAYADGVLAMVSAPRLTYQKTLPIGEDVELGEWVDCDGTLLQVGSISYDASKAVQVVRAGAEPDTINKLVAEQARQLDLLKRS